MKSRYELLRHGRYMLPCCLIMVLFLSACAEQREKQRGWESLLERLVSARGMVVASLLV